MCSWCWGFAPVVKALAAQASTAGVELHLVVGGLRRHRDVGLSVELVEASARLLPGLPASLDADLRRICEPYPVSFRTSTTIASVSAKGVRLADGTRLRSELTLWTAGLAPPALLRESGLAPPPQVWADVRATLQSRHFDNVFVVGDAALLPHAVGKQAYNAIDMGALGAANAVRFLAGRALKPFKPAPKPVLVAFGDLQTYLVAGRTVVASKVLAAAKEGVHQVFMAQMAPGSVLTSLPAAAGRLWRSWRQLASAGPAAVDVPGRLQEAAGSQGRQAAVDGTREGPGVLVDTPSPAGAADLCAFSAGQPRSTVQRKRLVTSGQFRGARATRIGCRTAVVRVGRQSTRCCHPPNAKVRRKAVDRARSAERLRSATQPGASENLGRLRSWTAAACEEDRAGRTHRVRSAHVECGLRAAHRLRHPAIRSAVLRPA